MIATLRDTFRRVMGQLKTHRILRAYEKADFETQAQFRQKELRRIAKNTYNLEAYFRLSIMAPKKTQSSRLSLGAMGVSEKFFNTRLTRLQKSHSGISNALLKVRGI